MAYYLTQRWLGRDRIGPAVAALLVNAIIGFALIMGLKAVPDLRPVDDGEELALFNLNPPVEKKPEPKESPKQVDQRGGGRKASPASWPNTQQVAPAPVAVVAPVPVIAVPATPLPAARSTGSGTGAGIGLGGQGGAGTGLGSGDGSGAGAGSGTGGSFSRARQTGGRFRNSDFPESVRGTGPLKIGVRYAIGPSGRVDECEIIEKSGYVEVDAMTCRIIMERYRFRPARDPSGYPVTEVREEDYSWKVR